MLSWENFVSACILCAQLCLTLCSSMERSLPGSCVHGILQARILEWVAISLSRGSSRPRDWTLISCICCIAGRFLTTEPSGKPHFLWYMLLNSLRTVIWEREWIYSVTISENITTRTHFRFFPGIIYNLTSHQEVTFLRDCMLRIPLDCVLDPSVPAGPREQF